MKDMEIELRRALRRKSAPPGFAARVSSRAREGRAGAARPGVWRAVAAAVILTVMGGGWAAQRAVERRQGEHARAEVLLALHITSSKVRQARQHVRDIGSR